MLRSPRSTPPMYVRSRFARERERLLREPFLLPEFSHTFTEALLNLRVTSLHPAAMESSETTMSPRTLRIFS